ncbi:MAG: Glucuronate isomerase [Herbinix sp.]|jgi:glucuronate isomerase|nr:Glucuronate isomerase [Herbinix sp.]
MKSFLDENFLLSTDTAVTLYQKYASKLPIIDYHCHINPREIAEDRHFDNITQVWLGGDHYKWRLMRANGVEECYITGAAPDKEKFEKWAETLSKCIGNPLYHWSHLELQRYFDYHGALSKSTAGEVWELCNKKLSDPSMSARSLIKMSNVTHICTTDDPIDSLEWHKMIAEDSTFDVTVLPTWRPDKAMNLEKEDYPSYLALLSDVSGVTIDSYGNLQKALRMRLEHFNQHGCKISDHGLDYVMYVPASEQQVEDIFRKRLLGLPLTGLELLQFKTAFMLEMGKAYCELDWAMQLHFGVKRNNNTMAFKQIGPDTGYDCINNYTPSDQLTDYLNALCSENRLPKTIIYSLNPIDNAAIDTIIGCFQDSSAIGKIQHGSAWWFNDHKPGMIDQLTSLASIGFLAGFVGMLTDSRSFLSYPRHEYFRRILCNLLATWVENGEYPADYETLGEIVEGISYYNAKRYFNF